MADNESDGFLAVHIRGVNAGWNDASESFHADDRRSFDMPVVDVVRYATVAAEKATQDPLERMFYAQGVILGWTRYKANRWQDGSLVEF